MSEPSRRGSATELREWLRGIAPGDCRCLFTDAQDDLRSELQSMSWGQADATLASIEWSRLPRIDHALETLVQGLAETASLAWPRWSGLALQPERDANSAAEDLQDAARERGLADLSSAWLAQAWRDRQRGRSIRSLQPAAVAIKHWVALLDAARLVILVWLPELQTDRERIDGVARAATFVAEQGATRVILVAQRSDAALPQLGRTTYGALHWVPWTDPERPANEVSARSKLAYWPMVGRPHPASPGELLLAQRLQADPALRDVFTFNFPVQTAAGTTYLVDLLAPREKVIIEIDGYRHHATRVAFHADRHRDFELQLSGYLVVRLPHDDVLGDPDGCCEKLKQALAFRRREASRRSLVDGTD